MTDNFNKKLYILNRDLKLNLPNSTLEELSFWHENFIEYNSHTNLLSKNEVKFLFEKHVFDSLGIVKWIGFKNSKKILDVGCGGGFPSVILAICFKDKKIFSNDSRIKKINFVNQIKDKLNLKNLDVIYGRIEEVDSLKVDTTVSRAVGKMIHVYNLSKKHLIENGNFLIYKSKLAVEELQEFKKFYKNFSFEIIPYTLPLEESYERKLIVAKKEY